MHWFIIKITTFELTFLVLRNLKDGGTLAVSVVTSGVLGQLLGMVGGAGWGTMELSSAASTDSDGSDTALPLPARFLLQTKQYMYQYIYQSSLATTLVSIVLQSSMFQLT